MKSFCFKVAMIAGVLMGYGGFVLPALAQDQGEVAQGAAVQEVVVSEIGAETALSMQQLLKQPLSGLQVLDSDGAPGSAFLARIRGLNSFRGDTSPLIVVDGVILNSPSTDGDRTFWTGDDDYQSVQNTLDQIEPADIEKITVLKDAAATALYGSLGGNGVILITTRRGFNGKAEAIWNSRIGLSAIDGKMTGSDRIALSHKHHVNVRGGTDKSDYSISAGYDDRKGILKGGGLQLAGIRLKYNQQFGKGSSFGANVNFNWRRNEMVMATSPLGTSSTVKALWMKGSDTPGAWMEAYDDKSTQYASSAGVYVNARIWAGLFVKADAGVDFRNKTRLRWMGSGVAQGAEVDGMAGQTGSNALRYHTSAALCYDWDTLEDHRIYASVGGGVVGSGFTENIYEGSSFFSEELRAPGISLAEHVAPYRHMENRQLTANIVSSLSYSFKERLFVGGSFRAEKTPRFDVVGEGMDYFPSAYVAWSIIKDVLKVRVSGGTSGAAQIVPFGYETGFVTGVMPELENKGLDNYYTLRWKNKTLQHNLGIDFSVVKGRLSGNVDIYHNESKDLLTYLYRLPKDKTPERVYENSARVQNIGAELGLSAIAVQKSDLKWTIDASVAYNHNEILDTGAEGDVFGSSIGRWNGEDVVVTVNRKGESVASFYGYKSQGLVGASHTLMTPPFGENRLKEGDVKFIDLNGDGSVTELDKTVIGNSLPKVIAALATTLTWRGLAVSMAFDGAFGFQVANMQRLYDTWQRAGSAENAFGGDIVSSRIVEDGSFIRLSTLTLSYDIPVQRIKPLRRLSISASTGNLLTISDYTGWSPTVSSYGYDLSRYGIDNGAFPSCRTFMLGLSLGF